MDPRVAARIADVESRQQVYARAPSSAIQPLKERLAQLRREFPRAPETDRPRIAIAITDIEQLIQKLERSNGPRRT